MPFIKFLFITILILWIIRVILRLIFPLVLKRAFTKMQRNGVPGTEPSQASKKPEGAISIDYMPPAEPRKGNSDKLGDFVDYEELK